MPPTTIPHAVLATVAGRPDQPAIVDGDHTITYAELADSMRLAARAMMAAGVEPGDRIAIWAPNGHRWIEAALGAHAVGATLVPVNTRWKGSEAAYVLGASRARVLFTDPDFLGADTVAMLDADDTPLPRLEAIVLLGGSATATRRATPVHLWDDFLAAGDAVEPAAADARLAALTPDHVSDCLFTSGTTGAPKGVLMTHAQTVRQFTDWCDFAGLEPGDRYLIVNPFFHMFGYKAGWVATLLRGATAYPVAVFDVAEVLATVEREAITVLPGAPTIYRSILDHPGLDRARIASLRVAVTGAADIPVSLIEEIRERLPFQRVLTGYGLTEAGTCTGSHPDDDPETIATTAGRAMPGLEIEIVGPDDLEVPRGETGELVVRGFSVMQGYLDDPEATAAAIDERGFLHTGDLATMDERGYVRIVGRLKDMLIVGGFNVYPAEVEAAMRDHPTVADVAVIGIPDERMGEVAMAWVVPADGATTETDADGIIAWCRERMANYKVPRRVGFLDALPRNATGKVVKDELRAKAGTE